VWYLRGVRLLRPNFWQVYRILNFLLIVVALLLQFVYSARQEQLFAGLGCNNITLRQGLLAITTVLIRGRRTGHYFPSLPGTSTGISIFNFLSSTFHIIFYVKKMFSEYCVAG
jgi:hypothetical protein